jgi:hypothetical protein
MTLLLLVLVFDATDDFDPHFGKPTQPVRDMYVR